jgi:hypothetical protein
VEVRRYRAHVEWRITFFVKDAERTADGWIVTGETGLGPAQVGDEFSFVHHEDDHTQDLATLSIAEAAQDRLRLTTAQSIALRCGDILGGEAER